MCVYVYMYIKEVSSNRSHEFGEWTRLTFVLSLEM